MASFEFAFLLTRCLQIIGAGVVHISASPLNGNVSLTASEHGRGVPTGRKLQSDDISNPRYA